MHAIVLAFVFGTAQHTKHHYEPDTFYSVKRRISSMTNVLSFTPTVTRFSSNRESHENRESLGDANHSPLRWITTTWTLLSQVLHCEHSNDLRVEGVASRSILYSSSPQ